MKKTIITLSLASLALSLQAQQTVGFVAGLPDTVSSPLFTLPVDAPAGLDLHITLATGPSLAAAEALKALSGIDLFNAFSPLVSGNTPAIAGFRSQLAAFNTPITMPGQSVSFTSAGQLWILASTSPITSLTSSDYLALIGAPSWQAAAPDAVVKPAVIMNMSLVTSQISNLFVGKIGSVELVPVPEPATYAGLFGVFALGFVALRRRRK